MPLDQCNGTSVFLRLAFGHVSRCLRNCNQDFADGLALIGTIVVSSEQRPPFPSLSFSSSPPLLSLLLLLPLCLHAYYARRMSRARANQIKQSGRGALTPEGISRIPSHTRSGRNSKAVQEFEAHYLSPPISPFGRLAADKGGHVY